MQADHMDDLQIPLVWLGEGDDRAAARAIEAAVYAQHLMDAHGPDPDLARVVESGERATEIFWWVGLRIGRRQAAEVARTANLPEDDLFQDACLAVARAVHLYDHTRGIRYTTYVHHVIAQELMDEDHLRIGAGNATRGDRRAARKAAATRRTMEHATLEDAANAAGVSMAAVVRGSYRQVMLDPEMRDEASGRLLDAIEAPGLGFLDLLTPLHRKILHARYVARQKLISIAESYGVSHSTIMRWESAALAEARAVLESDLTRRQGISQDQQPAAACASSRELSARRTGRDARRGP